MSERAPIRITIPAGSPTGPCRGCESLIAWVKTKAGKSMPVDPDGTPHWATCPKAHHFGDRKRPPPAPKAPVAMTYDLAKAVLIYFGKHAGKTIDEAAQAPGGLRYLDWVRGESWCRPSFKQAINAYLEDPLIAKDLHDELDAREGL